MEQLLKVSNLQTGFKNDREIQKVLHGIDLEVNKGEIVGLVGESGSGKSVTSLSIMQLLHGTPGKVLAGEINYKGVDLLSLKESEMRKYRGKELSMIFQEPMTSLNPVVKIGKQLTEIIMLHLKYSKKKAQGHAISMLESVGIPRAKDIMESYPHELSGGMLQRVMIAMQISCYPSLLIADEPTTALDVTIQAQILNLLKEIQETSNMGVLFITHDLGVVSEICDRVIVMYAGRIVEELSVDRLFEDASHPYTKGLIKSIPIIGQNKKKLFSIPGTVPSPRNMPKGCKFAPRCEFAMDICWQKEPALLDSNYGKSRCWLEAEDKEEAYDSKYSYRS
ncbi:peptide ABC transporter ATP-binding protein [Virgibacillus indicus]|uniref:Peptide ABC transporter ATP-binding protein n=1 Tax=Virgibacillus indicus TaxID=2024554 RepID=A0A265N6R9_9BACI|nr:ABC transporter ATP-binding protein [Virgibacillus indicus]OZU87174.1 peptide ABC transporter ATP-binding protein [Virgibacillus indicus]